MAKKAVKRIFEEKRKRRARLASLSFERKIEILIELQKIAVGTRKNSRHIVWPS